MLGFTGVDRDTKGNVAIAGVPGFIPGPAVLFYILLELGYIHAPQTDEYGVAGLTQPDESIGRVGGDAQRRVGLLVRRRCDGGVLNAVVFALIGEFLAFPSLEDDLQGLCEPFLAFIVCDTEDIVGTGESAAADAKFEPAFADVVDCRHFLGDAQGIAQR